MSHFCAGELTSGAKATHDQILEWLNLQDAQFGRLAGANNTAGAGNGTEAAVQGAPIFLRFQHACKLGSGHATPCGVPIWNDAFAL